MCLINEKVCNTLHKESVVFGTLYFLYRMNERLVNMETNGVLYKRLLGLNNHVFVPTQFSCVQENKAI